jgi:valyl-tRNA synthetase
VPLAGLIEPAAEIERLSRRSAKCRADIAKLEAKLANDSFVRHAPAEVVAGDRARLAELERASASFESLLERVRRLLT